MHYLPTKGRRIHVCFGKDRNEQLSYDLILFFSEKHDHKLFLQVKLNLSLLEDIEDDMEFCLKLAKEESLVILPGEHQVRNIHFLSGPSASNFDELLGEATRFTMERFPDDIYFLQG